MTIQFRKIMTGRGIIWVWSMWSKLLEKKMIIVDAFWRSWNGLGGKVMKSPPIEKSLPRACAIAPALRRDRREEACDKRRDDRQNASRILRPGTVRGCCCVTRRDRQREDEERGGKKEGDTPPPLPTPPSPAAAHSALVNRNRKGEWECGGHWWRRSKWTK